MKTKLALALIFLFLGTPKAKASQRTEAIRPGETLSQFSLRVLGTSRLWQKLYSWNRDRISSPERVMPGTLLRLGPPDQPIALERTMRPEEKNAATQQAPAPALKPYGKMELPNERDPLSTD